MSDDPHVVPGMEGEPVFAEPWQAQAFAMTVALHRAGTFAWSEWADALSDSLTREADYWAAWLRTLEAMSERAGLTSAPTLDERTRAWRRAADATPHGEPIVLDDRLTQ